MFKLFSSGRMRSAPTDCSTSSLSVETIPGGPSPDTSISPHNTQHQAVASGAAEDVGVHSQTSKTQHVVAAHVPTPLRTSNSELSPVITMAPISNAMPKKANEGSANHHDSRRRPSDATFTATAREGAELGPSASVASRRTNRSAAVSNVNGSAFANGAATAANQPPDVDPSLHVRAASAEDELKPREKAAIKKEDRMFVFFCCCAVYSGAALTQRLGCGTDGMGRRLSKIIKSEAKAEKAALHVALKELAEIQKLQKESIKVKPPRLSVSSNCPANPSSF
jgi:hypothetical protein